jgi:hypothetical protein
MLPLDPVTRQGPMTQRRIRNVCGRCNNGWMSQIVDRAKPFAASMIQDQPAELSLVAQRDLAGWIALGTIMGEFTDEPTACIPPNDRQTVMQTIAPPPLWTICVGRYAGAEYAPHRYRHWGIQFLVQSKPGPVRLASAQPERVQTTTYVLGALLVHVFSTTHLAFANQIRRDHTPDQLVRVWPPCTDTLVWPASRPVGDAYVNGIHDAINIPRDVVE